MHTYNSSIKFMFENRATRRQLFNIVWQTEIIFRVLVGSAVSSSSMFSTHYPIPIDLDTYTYTYIFNNNTFSWEKSWKYIHTKISSMVLLKIVKCSFNCKIHIMPHLAYDRKQKPLLVFLAERELIKSIRYLEHHWVTGGSFHRLGL